MWKSVHGCLRYKNTNKFNMQVEQLQTLFWICAQDKYSNLFYQLTDCDQNWKCNVEASVTEYNDCVLFKLNATNIRKTID